MYTLRKATMQDAMTLLQWKNDPQTIRNAIVDGIIMWSNHLGWLANRLKKPGFFIIMDQEVMCGDIRFDIEEEIEASIRIAPKMRGKHIASEVVGVASSLIQAQYQKPLLAKIVDGNTASYAVFVKAGFRPVSHHEENGKGVTVLKRGL